MCKRFVFFILTVFPLFWLSCSTYEGGGDYRYTQSKWSILKRFGTMHCFLTDDSTILQPSVALDTNQFRIGNRYKVYYQSLSSAGVYALGSTARLVMIEVIIPVLTKPIDSSYTGSNDDPITLNESPFISGGFLNLDFGFYKENSDIEHDFYLIQDSVARRKVYVRFVHNAYGDRPISKLLRLASFPLTGLSGVSSIDSIVVDYKQLNGERTRRCIALRDTLSR